MKLYKVTHYEKNQYTETTNPVTEWFGSERDAIRHRMVLLHDGKIRNRKDATLDMVDIPTKKTELLTWLNTHLR